MTTETPLLIEPDLELLTRLVQFCQNGMHHFIEAPPLRVTQLTAAYPILSFIDARGCQLQILFKYHAIEVFTSEHARPLSLAQTLTRALSGDEVYTALWKTLVERFVHPKDHAFPNL